MNRLLLSAFLTISFAASATAEEANRSLRERLEGFSVGAHRGGSTSPDGNTLHGFERVRAMGVDIVEMDLRLTSDGVPVVYHDPKIRWTTWGCSGEIAEMTLADIKNCWVNNTYQIPTFEEVLQWANGQVVVNAEFKTKEVIAPAVALVQRYAAYDWVYFQAQADPERYMLARAADPNVALLFKAMDEAALGWALGLNDPKLMVIEIDSELRKQEHIQKIHDAGKLVSENSWHYCYQAEMFTDCCDYPFLLGIDIAITKRMMGCIESRDRLEKERMLKGSK